MIVHQYDHTLLMETLLYHAFPFLGALAKRYVLPANGAALAYLGSQLHQHIDHKVPFVRAGEIRKGESTLCTGCGTVREGEAVCGGLSQAEP